MEQIPCINCLVFPICRNKALIVTPYIGIVNQQVINININNMIRSCSILEDCIGKTSLFEKKRIKRIQLLKHILNVKKLDSKKIYRLFIDDNFISWLDQFKGESLQYKDGGIENWIVKRKRKYVSKKGGSKH